MTTTPTPSDAREELRKRILVCFYDDERQEALIDAVSASYDLVALFDTMLAEKVRETEKAYGGCHNCYGKGYATVDGRWAGYDTDTDIGSPGGRVSGGKPNEMKFCDCERGRQLEAHLKGASK